MIYYKWLSILSILLIVGCDADSTANNEMPQNSEQSVLLISKDSKGEITTWMRALNDEILIKECYGLSDDSLDYYLGIADAIIIGGGKDINPIWYDRPEYSDMCGEFDNYRDSLEVKMIHFAANKKVPIMGICRGQQMLNVAHGGSLIPDIPTYIDKAVNHRSKEDSAHVIISEKDTWFTEHFNQDTFWVNSRHHQSIDRLAEGFEIAAYATYSVVEAIFIRDTLLHPFTMGVQFHPESLRDSLSNQLGMLLLNAMD